MSLPPAQYYPPRPRGRPPLADRHRNRLTLKLSGAGRASSGGLNSGASGAAATVIPTVPKAEHLDESDAPQLEEQFILRVLPDMAAQFSRLVGERRIQDHLEIAFRDERNAVVRFDGSRYAARLVDLPTITESYRTLDKKQMLKTADICQMLLIERVLAADEDPALLPLARGLDVIHPDGLSPALADVRRMRFRRRIPNAKIEAIEREVLRLLEEDAQAVAVKLEAIDIEQHGDDGRAATPSIDLMSPVTIDDLNTPMVADDDGASSIAMDDLEFDENLAAELEQGLEELEGEEEEEGEDEDEGEDEEEESDLDLDMGDQPNNERALQMRLLEEEIAELERTIRRKSADLDSAPNPIIRRRFEDMIQRLEQELGFKRQQLEQYTQEVADEEHRVDTPI
ncbi:hypothetical protein IWW39_004649 [Coemansia spiralis]|uniref:TAFII55 protein conserved region domain-containing protein n=1 Tax=Coemansia spiralis TaxID=417178 RepID=A0A9W8L1G7_9FUNG|nr:hypothetical protein IWW39_004649 [Coemansia spiralis]